ncbi:hypothetical protein BJF79_20300 [Actinomadura sp. CNU-125]|nr:hypothetical protein BJF79_20300 [Actinomadura sp. CNU-125]
MFAEAAGAFVGAGAPGRAVQAPHQDVVGVARLGADGRPEGGGTDRVRDLAGSPDEDATGVQDAQGQVGVLAVGAAETFVEAADVGERRAGRPCRR